LPSRPPTWSTQRHAGRQRRGADQRRTHHRRRQQARHPGQRAIIDLGNKTLLPGLIDAHTHITGAPEDAGYSLIAKSVPRVTLVGAKNALTTLRAGFTTIRDVGADNYTDIGLRDAINDGDVPGPRILASGPPLSITGGHCDDTMHAPEYKITALGVADGVDEALKVTRRNIKFGADVIKICATGGVLSFGDDPRTSQYTLDELKAIISDAHRLGRKPPTPTAATASSCRCWPASIRSSTVPTSTTKASS
jgi:imidazolonepropionase-like amidohydrolase